MLSKLRIFRLAWFAFAFCSLCLLSSWAINIYDEGLIITGAMRVLSGEAPSREFYTNYGPAQFYLVAATFKLFGTNLLVARAYDAVTASGIITITWVIAESFYSRMLSIACTVSVMAIVLFSLFQFNLYPVTPSIIFILGSALALVNHFSNRPHTILCLPLIGLLLGLFLFRYDLGLIGIVTFGLTLTLIKTFDVWRGQSTKIEVGNFLLANTTALFAGLALLCAGLSSIGILGPAIRDISEFNGTNYVQMRSLPFPSLSDLPRRPTYVLLIYLTPTCLLLSALMIRRPVKQAFDSKQSFDRLALTFLVSALIAVLFYTKGLVRVQPVHLIIANVASTIMAFCALDICRKQAPNHAHDPLSAFMVPISILLLGFFAYKTLPYSVIKNLHISTQLNTQKPKMAPLSIFLTDESRIAAANYVIGITSPEDRILSGTGRHDKVFINDNSFYFLTKRLPGTRWHQYDPGVQTSEEVQSEMIEELNRFQVSVIVRDRSFDQIREPNLSAESSGVRILDEYIKTNYPVSRVFGALVVHRRTFPNHVTDAVESDLLRIHP